MRIDCNQPGKHDCLCDDSCVMDGMCRNRIADRQSSPSSCCSHRLQQHARKPLAPINKRRPIDKQTNQFGVSRIAAEEEEEAAAAVAAADFCPPRTVS